MDDHGQHDVPRISDPTYQDRDIHIPIVMGVVVIALFTTAGTFLGMKKLYESYDRRFEAEQASRMSPMLGARELPSKNVLQVDEAADLVVHRAEVDAKLNGYRWIDHDAGTVQIPIERAIDLVAERGVVPVQGDDKSTAREPQQKKEQATQKTKTKPTHEGVGS